MTLAIVVALYWLCGWGFCRRYLERLVADDEIIAELWDLLNDLLPPAVADCITVAGWPVLAVRAARRT